MSTPRWIVVVGASAGGVESLQALFGALSATLDAAYLVVLHLSPHAPSHLDRVLGLSTQMAVSAAESGEPVRRGRVYVATADQHLVLDGSVMRLTHGAKESRSRPAVDVLFRSAAESHGPAVIGVLLSGVLDDGTAGLCAVKEHGGLAFVQAPREAMHASMPESAIRHVAVDAVDDCAGLARRIEAAASGRVR
jgi:two-component system chemotaxis response regulator CheB